MFPDEALSKLKLEEPFLPFVITLLGRAGVSISGVKEILYISFDEIKVGLRKNFLLVKGEGLEVAEIGGGDVLLKGKVSEVTFDS